MCYVTRGGVGGGGVGVMCYVVLLRDPDGSGGRGEGPILFWGDCLYLCLHGWLGSCGEKKYTATREAEYIVRTKASNKQIPL